MSNIFFVETHIFSKSGRLYYFTADFLLMIPQLDRAAQALSPLSPVVRLCYNGCK
ncbi:hypothetical protein HMPREF0239_05077 [Clostridium sp. ATCC BAA-442]|uniref:Uncharacterized protein n=1 Tax=Flavonifractor plautii ATCC 29863 TaxID=411475 RepID=G9YRM1_FLAPL|nr:hypothetical protein HMPREF0372_02170 [Flavonifractor plautii ATCC 29863]ERI62074.1 hypothetical protein HMPREF0239_05077 [Clostridium sp. ATCC BAA-442]